ncbi:MAG: phosphoribosylformylglycinamidine synthase subunit PurL [Deltaproteobacteria bacterium]|nr:MAG: phosphoribosylformylglycinamidine synthase subunit PurL [Deltaproteobacteria bacterium]
MNPEIIKQHGLTEKEYQNILDIMGREPTMVELGVFSVMWSEHCSYKSSKIYLKGLPTKGKQVVCGPGENAGVVDIGDGLVVVFKMESHNHPSMIEPFQGAATGVGGILRDVFTMGARPIALLNSLRFGAANHPKTNHLINGVVAGIAGYGNCMGIPTVGGEVYFEDCYNGNILVNAMCVGVARKEKIFYAKAGGIGNPVIYVGSKTGRDGIHGATMASDVFEEGSEEKRPTVQVGDPFTEKLVLEACLELMNGKDVVGIQDMGAAGLTCSSLELAGKGHVGIEMDLSKVPLRETAMTPYEIMLSESQERMFFVAKKGTEKKILKLFEKWDLDAAVVGKVIKGQNVFVYHEGQLVGTLPTMPITECAPMYKRPVKKPDYLEKLNDVNVGAQFIAPENKAGRDESRPYGNILKKLLSSPNIASKKWVYRQYDHMVGTNTAVIPGSDAAVMRLKEPHTGGRKTKKGLALTSDCNSRYCYLDPKRGAMIAVAEAARNIVCSGGKPLATTDCLNFGSPENPGVMWQFREALKGMGEACKALNTPIVSGNVSFYNESPDGAIYPTPTIGMVGVLDDVSKHVTQWFKNVGDVVVLLGDDLKKVKDELGGSEYLKVIHQKVAGMPPKIDLKKEKVLQNTCLEAIKKGLIQSAHDCSEGGLAVALAESCFTGPKSLGVAVDVGVGPRAYPDKGDHGGSPLQAISLLFSETQSRILVSVKEKDVEKLLRLAKQKKCPSVILGQVIENDFVFSDLISVPVEQLKDCWENGLERAIS